MQDAIQATPVESQPAFDLELFMTMNQSKRLDGETAAQAEELWTRWLEKLQVRELQAAEKGYLVAWLDATVEDEVNKAWDGRPSQAFTMNTVAQALLMAVVRELAPEVAVGGCAPVPHPTPELKEALAREGLDWTEEAVLSRQFAMLTYYPYQGSCPICLLKDACPKPAMMEAAARQ